MKKAKSNNEENNSKNSLDVNTNISERSFYQTRITYELGISEDINEIKLKFVFDGIEKEQTFKIFSPDDVDNIKILVYDLNRNVIQYGVKDESPIHSHKNSLQNFFSITRLKNPSIYTDKQGLEQLKKYDIPKGAGTYPFFPPLLLAKYEAREEIPTLVLTEGYFKAFKGCMHGIPTVGLSSITHVKEKETESMYADVLELINKCKVKNVIMLYDGDCRNISLKALEKGTDLFNRPAGFVQSASKIRELFKDYNLDFYFAHVDSENIDEAPKGLDDLLILEKSKEQDVAADLLSFSKRKTYFYSVNITNNAKKLWDYFRLNDVDLFYLYHDKYLNNKEFVFRGTKYSYNSEKGKCQVTRPREADNFFRVGDSYFEFVMVPNKYGQLEKRYDLRLKSTISDDYGKDIFEHIPKYKAFCNVPNHENYSRIINNCFNLYNEFEFTPEEGDITESISFMKHIFGEQFELGLGYIQLLYKNPTHILPVLCLVSKENNTGKSTFIKWLKEIFLQNMSIVGNADFSNDFNSHWAGKLIIACEESFIDKSQIMQKIKNLSTASKTTMNRKGKDQGEIDFYGKFILASNEVEHFIYASSDDIRFWVRNVKVPEIDRPGLGILLKDEIPAFLHFLSKREMFVKSPLSRMWFTADQIRTEAFCKVVEANRPRNEREIRTWLSNIFTEFGSIDTYRDKPCLYITAKMIREKVFNNRIPLHELSKLIVEKLKPDLYLNEKAERIAKRCKIPNWTNNGIDCGSIEYYEEVGKPYVFYAEDYLKGKDLENFMNDYKQKKG